MKKIIFALAIISMTTLATTGLWALNGEVITVNGKVEYQDAGGAWKQLQKGEPVNSGTMISTGFRSNATIKLGASILTVKQLTRMTLTELTEREETVDTGVYLEVGTVKAEVNSFNNKRNGFTVKSPVATASVRGTVFEMGDRVTILQGSVMVSTNLGQKRTATAGQKLDVTGDTLKTQIAEKKQTMKKIALSSLPSKESNSPIEPPATSDSPGTQGAASMPGTSVVIKID